MHAKCAKVFAHFAHFIFRKQKKINRMKRVYKNVANVEWSEEHILLQKKERQTCISIVIHVFVVHSLLHTTLEHVNM